MIKKIFICRVCTGIAFIVASITQLFNAQITEIGLYGQPMGAGTYPLTFVSQITNPTNYNSKVNKITIWSITGLTQPITGQVNDQGDFATTITSGPCAGQSLYLTPADYCASCHTSIPNPLVLAATDQVTRIRVRYSDATKTNMEAICIFVIHNSGAPKQYCYGYSYSNNNNWQSDTANQEFVGFKNGLTSTGSTCKLTGLSIYQRPIDPCPSSTITAIDVSSFHNGNLLLVSGALQSHTLSSTYSPGLTCTISYQIAVTGPNPNLITLSGNTVTFATSDVLVDAGTYYVAVQAQISGQSTWSAATTGTFNYVDPCVSASMTGSCWNYLAVNLFSTGSVFVNAWSDSVTNAKNNGTQICAYTAISQTVTTVASTQTSMVAKIIYTNTATTYTITAAPTLSNEITGTNPSYQITSSRCLSDAPAQCISCVTLVTVNCAISSVKILQQTPSGILTAQSWTISSSTQFTYQLAVDTTTTCGYTPTSWSVVTTSSNNVAAVGNFQTISSAGLFSAGTFTDSTNAGIYNVSVTSVTLNGVIYSTTSNPGITNTVASPNSFQLTVQAAADPCLTATVAASSVAPISVFAYQNSAVYSPFQVFTYTLSSMPTTNCGAFTYSVTLALGTALNTLTTFALSSGTTGFQVYSGNINQKGTFTATLTGALQSYPSRSAQTTFTINVVDPCSTTSLTATPTSLNAMSYSVSQAATCTQPSPSFNDAVSNSQSQTLTICGGVTYSISDSASGGATTLTTSELTVSPSGLITVLTTNAATVGSHTATLLVKLTNYPSVTLSLPFPLTITTCTVTSAQVFQSQSLATPAALIAQSYSTNSATGFSLQLSIIQTPACGYTVSGWGIASTTVTGSTLPVNSLAVDANSGILNIVPNLASTSGGTSTITINSVSINGVQWGGLLTSPSIFQLTVTSPCSSTTVYPTSIPDVSLKVWEGSTTTAYNPFPTATLYFSDSASTAAGTPGMCALSYTASISTSGTGQSITTFAYSGSQFNIYSNNMLQIGAYTVTVTGTVSQYTSQSAQTTFRITVVDPCLTTTLIANPPTLNLMSYLVSQAATCTQQVPNFNDAVSSSQTQTLNICGGVTYSISDSVIGSVAALSLSELTVSSSGLISVQTTNSATQGQHTVTLTTYLTSYTNVQLALQFILTITQQSCLSTTIVGPSSIQNLVGFAGYSTTTSNGYTFNDTVSQQYTLSSDTQDYCGPKQFSFQVNLLPSNILTGTNTQSIKFSPATTQNQFGSQSALLTVFLQANQAIQKQISFTVTTLGNLVPVIPNQMYQVGDATKTITFDAFEVLPRNYSFSPPLISSLQAYIITNASSISHTIDLNNQNLVKIQNQSWINFQNVTQTFLVQTFNNTLAGNYTIVVVQSIDQFPDVNPYAQFILQIQQTEVKYRTILPPYFDPPLKNSHVQQCVGQPTPVWSYIIPQPIDPLNGTISINVALDSQLFTYDNYTWKIRQTKVDYQALNLTVKIGLVNSFNQSSNFAFQVFFNCSATQNITDYLNPQEKAIKSAAQQKQWPTAYIQNIDPTGLMLIRFNQKMLIPNHPEYIQNETVLINGTYWPILQMKVIPGQQSDKKLLLFNWTFVSFTSTELQIQLTFENVLEVSCHQKYEDYISVQFFGIKYFADTSARYMHPETLLKPKALPRMTTQSILNLTQEIGQVLSNTVNTFVLSNIVISLLIQGPLQQILESVKKLQIIIHIMLVNLAYPASASVFFGLLMQVVTFQFYNFSNFYSKWFKLDDYGNTPLSDQFNLMGYNALYIIQNFGTLCWVIFVTPAIWFLTSVIVAMSKGEFKHLKEVVSRQMFFNNWITFINETYLFLGMCAALNFYYLQFDTYGNIFNSTLSIFFGTVIILFPLYVIFYYSSKQNYALIQKQDKEFMGRYGSVIDDLNFLRVGRKALLYPFSTTLRKLTLIYVTVYMQDKPVYSIFVLIYQAVYMITLVGYVEPYKNLISNNLDLMNESFVILLIYHMLAFTDFVPDLNTRQNVGISLIALTCLDILINLGVVTYLLLSNCARRLKLFYLSWKQRQAISERRKKAKWDAVERQWSKVKQEVEQQVARRLQEQRDQVKLQNEDDHQQSFYLQTDKNQSFQQELERPKTLSLASNKNNQLIKQEPVKKDYKNQLKFHEISRKQSKATQNRKVTEISKPFENQLIFLPEPPSVQDMITAKTKNNNSLGLFNNMKNSYFQQSNPRQLTKSPTVPNASYMQQFQSQIAHTNKSAFNKLVAQRNGQIQREHGIDSFILSEIENGNLDRELQEYAQIREDLKASFRLETYDLDFGEYSPEMSLSSQGKLYSRIIDYKNWKANQRILRV